MRVCICVCVCACAYVCHDICLCVFFTKTAVPCVPVGVFDCPLVVTMRPVPADMVTTAAKITHLNPHAHGAPIHIGDPGTHLNEQDGFIVQSLLYYVMFTDVNDVSGQESDPIQ